MEIVQAPQKCPLCKKTHQAYALFPPACQKPSGDPYTYFVDGKKA